MLSRLLRCRLLLLVIALVGFAQSAWANPSTDSLPNLVVIFIDDMGYADIGPFGCEAYRTPHLDQLAQEGRKFTDFHVSSAVCSSSRAALLTGCYHERVSIRGALFPNDVIGLNPEETTLAELCKTRGYATGCFGKWHLGHLPPFRPSEQGFDRSLWLPYSNDMWPYLDGETSLDAGTRMRKKRPMPPLPLMRDDQVINPDMSPEDQAELTRRYTEEAVAFIEEHAGTRPFFCYVPHTMVHIPLFASKEFQGKSGAGVYGDVVMELDWSVGQIADALQRTGVAENTLLLFTSDNGPWLRFGTHGGSAGPFREGKGTMFEGGTRVPCIARWPGKIPAGSSSDQFWTTIDLLPTFAKLIDAELPAHTIDGQDVHSVLTGDPQIASPRTSFWGYYRGELQTVRDQRWKLIFPHWYPTLGQREAGTNGKGAKADWVETELALYDLQNDPGETTNLVAKHPEIVARLRQEAVRARQALGDRKQKITGSERRPAGRYVVGLEGER